VATELQERLRRGVKQQLQQRTLINLAPQDQRVQLVRQRKHVVTLFAIRLPHI
jgi:hypothetical protein